jgi:hypothetical protein
MPAMSSQALSRAIRSAFELEEVEETRMHLPSAALQPEWAPDRGRVEDRLVDQVVIAAAGRCTGCDGAGWLSSATGGGSTAPGYGSGLSGHPAGVVERTPEQHLDVGIEAAKLVGGPSGQSVMDRRVDAQQHLFALTAHV